MSSEQNSIPAAEVDQLLQSPESADLEFKAELHDEEQAARLIAAMANSGGGKIVLGVADGKAVGLKSPAKTKRVAEQGAQTVEPSVPVAVKELRVDGSPIVVADVGPTGDRHLYVPPGGAIVKRAADGQTFPVSQQDLIGAFAQSEQAPTPSEMRLAAQLAKANEELLAALKKGFEDSKRLSGWRGQWRGWVISAGLGAVISLGLTLIFAP